MPSHILSENGAMPATRPGSNSPATFPVVIAATRQFGEESAPTLDDSAMISVTPGLGGAPSIDISLELLLSRGRL